MAQYLQTQLVPGVCWSWKIQLWVVSVLSAHDVVLLWNCPQPSYLCIHIDVALIAWKRFFKLPPKLKKTAQKMMNFTKNNILHSISLHINTVFVLERQKRAYCCQCLTWDMTVRGLQFNSTTNISTQGLHSTHNITVQVFFIIILVLLFFFLPSIWHAVSKVGSVIVSRSVHAELSGRTAAAFFETTVRIFEAKE